MRNSRVGGGVSQISSRFGVTVNPASRKTIRLTGHETAEQYSAFGSPDPYEQSCRYSWVETLVQNDSDCSNQVLTSDLYGFSDLNPAIEINGVVGLEPGTVVEAWLSPEGDHWLFAAGGGGGAGRGSNNICCIGAPFGIYAFASQTCCDNTVGFTTGTFYLFWDVGCVPHIYTTRAEAVEAATNLGLPANVYGECEAIIEDE